MNVQSVCTQGQVCKDSFLHISDNNVTLGRGERCRESWCLFWLGKFQATSPCHKASLMLFSFKWNWVHFTRKGVHLLSFKLLSFYKLETHASGQENRSFFSTFIVLFWSLKAVNTGNWSALFAEPHYTTLLLQFSQPKTVVVADLRSHNCDDALLADACHTLHLAMVIIVESC